MPFYEDSGNSIGTNVKFRQETEKHILPSIGKYYVNAIDIKDCQKLVNTVRKKRKDFRKIIGHARQIFDFAVQEEYISENPLDKVVIKSGKVNYEKRRVSSKENYYTPTQLMNFLELYGKLGEFHEFVYWRLLSFSGLRRGEGLALYKDDLIYKDKAIRVNKTLTEGGKGNNTVLSHFTKTDDADSPDEFILYLDDYTFELLDQQAHKTDFVYANNIKTEIHNSKYLFPSPKTEKFYHRSAPNEWLKRFWEKHKKALEDTGLHYISPHGFRHSQATMLYELDINPKDAQSRLRHKNLKTTMDVYTHISENRNVDTTNKLNDFQKSRTTSRATVIDFDSYKRNKA